MRSLVKSSLNRASHSPAAGLAAFSAAPPLDDSSRAAVETDASDACGKRLQITMSPYYGRCDLSSLSTLSSKQVDVVSLADLMRNGFVYPPHSSLRDVKLVTSSFDPSQDMSAAPGARFMFRHPSRGIRRRRGAGQDWVGIYHRLLCEAVASSCDGMRSPWLLQSGGKDSTSIAIAAAEVRPDTTCITYFGGREEDEVASASAIADALGLRHETLTCDPGRAYDRYLAIVGRMPLLTADFALLAYVDLATQIAASDGDGIVDGVGSDNYFGHMVGLGHRWLPGLARGIRLPPRLSEMPVIGRNFPLCYVLSTMQMSAVERAFPGSRFTDAEVDALFGREVSALSKARLRLFQPELDSADNAGDWWGMASSIAGSASAVAKGLFTTAALSLQAAYPFCDRRLREWVFDEVPRELRLDPATGASKVLMRRHIATRFGHLPYVARKGSFRFDLRGLARERFDQVHAFAHEQRSMLPGATAWLERNRGRLANKYHASKFYLLAVLLPWIAEHGKDIEADGSLGNSR